MNLLESHREELRSNWPAEAGRGELGEGFEGEGQCRHCSIFRTVAGGHDWRVDIGDTDLPWHPSRPKGLGRQAVAEKLVVHSW